jgi:hypothetical protein
MKKVTGDYHCVRLKRDYAVYCLLKGNVHIYLALIES